MLQPYKSSYPSSGRQVAFFSSLLDPFSSRLTYCLLGIAILLRFRSGLRGLLLHLLELLLAGLGGGVDDFFFETEDASLDRGGVTSQ